VAGGLSPAAPDAHFGRPTRPKASRKPKPRDCNYAVPSLETYRSSKKLDSNPIDYIRLSSMNSIGSAHADHPAPRERSHVSTPDRILFINAQPRGGSDKRGAFTHVAGADRRQDFARPEISSGSQAHLLFSYWCAETQFFKPVEHNGRLNGGRLR
jgi:hypothetical protein